MNRVLAIAFKDLRSTWRNVPALMMMLAAPLALSALLGFAFGGGGSGFSIAATKVAVVNQDQAQVANPPSGSQATGGPRPAVGQTVVGIMKSKDLKSILAVTSKPTVAAARKSVDDGKDAVAVIIPAGLSKVIFGTSTTARSAIELYQNPTQTVGAAITQSVVGQSLLSFNGARAAALAAQGLAVSSGNVAQVGALTQKAAQTFVHQSESGSGGLTVAQRPPELTGGKKSKDVGVTGLVLAGMMVFFMFFAASNVARTILDEERAGTLPRLFTTPTSRQLILGGKFTSTFLTVLVQAIILVVAGRLFFAIQWGALSAVSLLILVAAAVAASLGLMVISLVRTPAQAGAIGAGVYLVLALLGGNFSGTAQSGTTYATMQRLTPNGWLLVGWNSTLRGGGVGDILLPLLVPLAFAVVFFAIAVLRFRRRFA
jgi:ABC-type multidrug transport system permease subunit